MNGKPVQIIEGQWEVTERGRPIRIDGKPDYPRPKFSTDKGDAVGALEKFGVDRGLYCGVYRDPSEAPEVRWEADAMILYDNGPEKDLCVPGSGPTIEVAIHSVALTATRIIASPIVVLSTYPAAIDI